MEVKTVVVGSLNTNCYVLKNNNDILIIDPGDDGDVISSYVNGDVKGILVTHSHFDHIGAVQYLKDKYNVPVYNKKNLKLGLNVIGSFKFECLSKPGHLDDLVCFYFKNDKIMFVGDFIFKGSIGRTDLNGGNSSDMINSIKEILEYEKNIKLYPGHGPSTTLYDEFYSLNYFIKDLENN